MTKKLLNRVQIAKRCGVQASTVTMAAHGWPDEAFNGKMVYIDHPAVAKFIEKHARPKRQDGDIVDPLCEHALAHGHATGDWTITGFKKALSVGHSRARRIHRALEAAELLPGMAHHKPPKTPIVPDTPAPQPKPAPTPPPVVGPNQPNPQEAPMVGDRSGETLDSVMREVPQDLRDMTHWSLHDLIKKFGTHTSLSVWLKSVKELEMIEEKRLKNDKMRGDLVDKDVINRVLDIFDTQHMRLLKDGAKSLSSEIVGKHQAGVSIEDIEVHISKRLGTFITAAKTKIARLELKGRKY